MTRRRVAAAIVLVLVLLAGLLVHGVLPESAFADISGDMLYVGAVYLGLVVIVPRLRPWAAGGISLLWSVGVELLQLTGIPQQLGAAFPPATLVLGSTFDARDLYVYAAAAVLIATLDALTARRARPAPPADPAAPAPAPAPAAPPAR